MKTLDRVLDRLKQVKSKSDGYMAECPAHDDSNPSLSITSRAGRILINCFAGCETEAVVQALGMKMSDLFINKRGN